MTDHVNSLAQRFWQAPSAEVFEQIQENSILDTETLRSVVLHYNAAMHLGIIEGAELALNQLASRFPQHPLRKLWPVEINLAQNDFDAAIEIFAALPDTHKADPNFLLKWINICIDAQHTQGLDIAAQHVDALPDGIKKFEAAASMAKIQQDLEGAADSYRKILDLKPDHSGAAIELSKLLAAKGDRAQARKILENSWNVAPGVPQVRGTLLSLVIQDAPEQLNQAALDDFITIAQNKPFAFGLALSWAQATDNSSYRDKMLLRLDTEWPERAAVERAEMALAQGNAKQALALTDQTPEDQTLHHKHFMVRAKALRALRERAGLEKMIEELSTAPTSPNRLIIAAAAANFADDMSASARLARAARIDAPDMLSAWKLESDAMIRNGEGHAVLKILDTVPDSITHSEVIIDCRFRAARAIGDFTTARQTLKALALEGTLKAKCSYVEFLCHMENVDEAQEFLTTLTPSSTHEMARVSYVKGCVSLARFDPDNAIAEFDQSIQADPNFAMAYSKRAVAHLFRFAPQHATDDLNKESHLKRAYGTRPWRARDGIQGQLINELLLAPQMTEAASLARQTEDAPETLLKLFAENDGNTMLAIGILIAMRQGNRLDAQAPEHPNQGSSKFIPPKIFQYWEGAPPTAGLKAAMDQVAGRNPWAEYHRFDGDSGRAYVRAHGSPEMARAFMLARHPAERADLLRLVVLGHEGGIWIDADDICREDLSGLLPRNSKLVLFQEWLGSTANNFIAAAPASPILQQVAEEATRDILSGASESLWLRTGPGALSRSVVRHMARSGHARLPEGIHILAASEILKRLATNCPFPYKQTQLNWQATG
ncbi:tetratricopeptide repeat protein [Phaeobacter marinintestinus]|uniref:tetratricopeptide repeat protein n=1 Tax=Falsiphaeobacter marinintestinus TaxID=1492905 RepID=UPI0011B41221|nr:tetratricopeptide repeat protein [Phaeobacter marinintestinus]